MCRFGPGCCSLQSFCFPSTLPLVGCLSLGRICGGGVLGIKLLRGMSVPATIDLNGDMGESFGLGKMGNDAEVMEHITSANIACGAHAGDPSVMAQTVALAKGFNVAVGAHPGFPDLQGFGRRALNLSHDEIINVMLYQLGALSAVARAAGLELHHVKPHGALYKMACANSD